MSATGAAVLANARRRGITEILHFSTNRGLVGILASEKLLSHDRLEEDEYLENIRLMNSPSRAGDADWTDWVNLSISRVNGRMLKSSKKWHPEDDIWWVVLAFDVEIVGHDNVEFATTNNTYGCALRGSGVDAFDALFAPAVEWGHYGSVSKRYAGMPDSLPTDAQAEVLYPVSIGLEHLRALYVAEPEQVDEVAGFLAVFAAASKVDLSDVAVACNPDVFITA